MHTQWKTTILKRKTIDNGLLYTPIVVPDILKDCLLILPHDKQGHNSFRRTYISLKNRYHWKGMRKSVHQHCTSCQVCAKHNIKTQQLKNEHFSSPPQTMEFIAMDHGIHSNGLNRRIPPSVQRRHQIHPNSSMHAHGIYILHSTEIKTCRRCNKSLHQPYMLPLWTMKENPHRQWN